MALAINAYIEGANGALRTMKPHRFRDGYFRMQRPGDTLDCLHVEDLRSVCRYLAKGYLLAMSSSDGHSMPSWTPSDSVRIGVR
ncbi:hypothetical protein [Maricaulis sp. CAU 1757]